MSLLLRRLLAVGLLLAATAAPPAQAAAPAPAPAPAPAASPAKAAAVVPWHHPAAPYRAAFEVRSLPNHPRAGYFIEVPICGLGDPDGREVWAYTAANKPLRTRAIGRTRDNRALVVVGDDAPLSDVVYAYWGDDRKAPQDHTYFIPGLTVDIRTCKLDGDVETLESSTRLFDASTRLGVLPVGAVNLGYNPLTHDDAFIMDFRGALLATQTGRVNYLIATDDAGFLTINDKLVIARPGRRDPRDANGQPGTAVDVVEGPNPFRLLVLDVGGGQTASLFRVVDARQRPLVKGDEFVQSGSATLVGVEARDAAAVCPVFSVSQVSYIGYDGVQLTEVRLRSLSGKPLDWGLGNGIVAANAVELSRLVVGPAPLRIEARPARGSGGGKAVASGVLHFTGVPEERSIWNWGHYVAYRDLIVGTNLEKVHPDTLSGYFAFLTARERNPDTVPVGVALVRTWNVDPAEVRQTDVLLELARAAAGPDPGTARKAYLGLLRAQVGDREERDNRLVAAEYLEFEIFRGDDPARTAKALEEYASEFADQPARLTVLRALHALLQRDRAAVDAALGDLRARLMRDGQGRRVAVQGNAAVERFRLDSGTGYYARAEEALRTWIATNPEALADGQYALLTAAYFRRLGWNDSALALIDSTLAYNELPAYLPDLEMERAHVLVALGRPDEARVLYDKVSKVYPNHPVAPAARKALAALPPPAPAAK